MIRILVADDHAVVRNGLKLLIGEMQDAVVAGIATNGDEVLEALQHGEFDLILLDLTMPGLSGVELISRIHELNAELPVLVLSMRNELYVIRSVIHAGIAGYVAKGSNEDYLIAAIRKVAAGDRYIDPSVAELLMFEGAVRGEPQSIEHLSQRELQIMKFLAQGTNITEIAKQLEISMKSVSTYKARLMVKMDFKSISELAIYAAENGLI